MYEIWSFGHKPYEGFTNAQVALSENFDVSKTYRTLLMQAMEMVAMGYRLSPPPGCPRRMYSLMISCW